MLKTILGLCFCVILLIGLSCNPECTPVSNLKVLPAVGISGTEVLIQASPLEALLDQDLNIQFDSKPVTKRKFHPNLGLVVTIPEGVSGRSELTISNPDCVERLDFNVVEASFFEKNRNFIPPSVPLIYIPISPLPPYPPTLENAWLNPENLDYCIWFKFLKDPKGKCTLAIDPTQSFEQSTCNGTNTTLLYNKNPISGILDTTNNIVHFWIDRTKSLNGNLGVEEFEGRFINIKDTNYKDFKAVPCGNAWKQERNHMILATSKQTSRQLIIFQQAFANPSFMVDCK